MSCGYDTCDLEEFDAGRLSAEKNAAIAEHVASCPRCRDEMLWLLREQRLMAARAARSADAARTDAIWSGIAGRVEQERLTRPARPPDARSPLLLGGLAAAAVVLLALFATRGGPRLATPEPAVTAPSGEPAPAADVETALDAAERQYAAAEADLEKRYRRRRAALAPDEVARADQLLSRGRPRLRPAAAADVEMRQVMLATHADYVHALHAIVGGMEDVR